MFKNNIKTDDIFKNEYLLLEFKPSLKKILLSIISINIILIILSNSLENIDARIIEYMIYINIGTLMISFFIDVFFKKMNIYIKYRYLLGEFSCYVDNEILYYISKNRDIKINLKNSILQQSEGYSIIVNNENFKIILINDKSEDYKKLIDLIKKKVQGVYEI